jgi:hypothetical protein
MVGVPRSEGSTIVGIVGSIGAAMAKRVGPNVTGASVRSILERAIDGFGPLSASATSADTAVRKAGGDTDVAIDELIDSHVKLAGAQGFVTNIGGLMTMAVAAPANLAAVALVQCHLAAEIIHIRGYDLAHPSVRNAVLVCLLDVDARKALAKDANADMSAAAVAAGEQSAEVRQLIGRAVAGSLLTGIGGKRVAAFAARRIPVLGGAVGAAGDAWATRRIGRETAKMPRPPRGSAAARLIIVDAVAKPAELSTES